MEIKNPRRILFLGPPDSGILTLLKDLTGSAPEPRLVPSNSITATTQQQDESQLHNKTEEQSEPAPQPSTTATTAGLTHALPLRNSYYTATIPIWLDEPTSPSEWKTDFLAPEAAEVVRAVGAWVLVFRIGALGASGGGDDRLPSGTEWVVQMMDAVKEVVRAAHGGMEDAWDGVMLCVGMPLPHSNGSVSNVWDDLCWDRGFEFVDASIAGDLKERNVDGETKGVKRVVEALEANDWSGQDDGDDEFGLLDDDDGGADTSELNEFGPWQGPMSGEDAGFALERREMEREIWGLKMAINGPTGDDEAERSDRDDEDLQVEELERMMGKMLAVRDMTAHMPEGERKKFAARAVNDVMKTM